MLVISSNDLGQLHKALTDMDDRALPYAVRNSLNQSAFLTRSQWESEGRRTMHVRRSWAFRHRIPKARGGGLGHAVEKARLRKNIAQMQSKSGNTHRFMDQQERGFTRFRSDGVQIPTTPSRIGGNNARIVRKMFYRDQPDLAQLLKDGPRYEYRAQAFAQTGPKSRQHRYIAGSARAARARGSKFVYLEFGKKKGIYSIGGGKGGRGSKIKKVWDMSNPSTSTPRNPMLRRTIRKLDGTYKRIHASQIENQIFFVLRKRGFSPTTTNAMAALAQFRAQ